MNQDKFKNLIASIPTEWLQQEDVKDREGTDCHFGSKRSRRQFRTTNCPQGTNANGRAWWSNHHPLDAIYPMVFMDCIVVKVRNNQRVVNKAIFVALGINLSGNKELLGLWLAGNEGVKFCLSVLTELKNQGVVDILIACIDSLKGWGHWGYLSKHSSSIVRCSYGLQRHAFTTNV